jgi:hypothetical protein
MAKVYDTAVVLPQALKLLKRTTEYEIYQKYYKGHHRLTYASEKWRRVFGRLFRRFADNLCPTVIDAVGDRLEIQGFCVKTTSDQSDAEKKANKVHEDHILDVWDANKMEFNAGRIHLSALRDGDAYVIVWPDPENPTMPIITPQDACLCRIKYNPEYPGRVEWGVKVWFQDDGKVRLTLYYSDRIEKYVSLNKNNQIPARPAAFVPFDAAHGNEDDTSWPIENPFGIVPLFHFANNAAIGEYGESELRDVLPVQDALNKSVLDLIAAMEYHAMPQRHATGLELETDETTGEKIQPFKPGGDQLWAVAATDVTFGQFPGSDVTQLVTVADSFRTEIARITGTPLHYFLMMSDPPSGEALKALESRLIKKCKDRAAGFGNVWSQVVRFCHIIQGHPETIQFEPRWIDPAPHSEKEHAETLAIKKTLGVPRDQLLKEMDYTDAQLEEFETMREEEAQNVGETILNQMARGQMDTGGTQPGQSPGKPGGQQTAPNGNGEQGAGY